MSEDAAAHAGANARVGAEPRSWLFIPADSDKKLGRADAAGADALILDLEDSVAPANKAAARERVPATDRYSSASRRALLRHHAGGASTIRHHLV